MAVPAVDIRQLKLREEKQLLERLIDKELAEIGLADFWVFMHEILYATREQQMHYSFDFHAPVCRKLQNLTPGDNLLLLLPREHRKTHLVMAWAVWLITRDPNIRINFVSLNEDRAKKLAAFVREVFRRGASSRFAKYQHLYPHMVVESRRELFAAAQFTLPLRTVNLVDPTVFSTYLGGGTGGRADVMIMDDPWDNRTLGSDPARGASVMRDFLVHLPIIESSSLGRYKNLVITATPWRYYDIPALVLGHRFKEYGEEQDELEKLSFHAIVRHGKERADMLCEYCPKHVVDYFPHGHPDWNHGEPALYPIFGHEELDACLRKARLIPDQGEAFAMLQYQCIYTNPETQKLREEWFILYDKPAWIAPKRRVLALDDASKDFQAVGRGDYCVALFGEFDDAGRLLLRHGMSSNRWTRDEFLRAVIAWCSGAGWWPQVVVKEKVGNDAFLSDLSQRLRDSTRPAHMVVIPRAGLGRKNDWIVGGLQGPLERAEIVVGSQFPEGERRKLIHQTCNLGSAVNDDYPDALRLFFTDMVRVPAAPALGRPPDQWGAISMPQPFEIRRHPATPAQATVTRMDQAREYIQGQTSEAVIYHDSPATPETTFQSMGGYEGWKPDV
jgi:hypothetical protein